MSYTQIMIILEIFKDFFACKFVLAANHQSPKTFEDFFACRQHSNNQQQPSSNQQQPAVSQPQPAIIQQPEATSSN